MSPEHEVISINPKNKTVTESYDQLILSLGARAFILPIDGLKKSVVLGEGFFSIEMTENLKY